jgi:UDPglucose 6-dehydrogenase/GDP-mannose 6-dehydrogenase
LPKDTKALSAHGVAHGQAMPLLDAVIATNLAQPARMLALLQRHFSNLSGLRVAVLGLAFKEDTDDMRESPAIPIVRQLVEQGALVTAYDPIAADAARKVLPDGVRYAASLEQALQGADAAMLVTRWDEFQRVPALLKGRADAPVLIDGRRVLAPATVPRYEGVGRRPKELAS